jgi:hypothetical protein
MVRKEDNIYFKKFTADCHSYIDNRAKQLEYELRQSSGSILKLMMEDLEIFSCEVYGYNSELLKKKRLEGLGVDISHTLFTIIGNHTEYNLADISAYYAKGKETVSLAKRNHSTKDPKIPHERVYLANYKKIEQYFLDNIKDKTHLNYEPTTN